MILRNFYLIIFLFFYNLSFGQQIDFSKRITYIAENQTIIMVIHDIGNLAGISFSYSKKAINAGKKISFEVKNMTVEQTLEKLNKLTGIEYAVVEEQIVLKLPKRSKTEIKQQQQYTINGFIKDKNTGESLIGTTVFITGSGLGTTTNAYGFYSLTLPAGEYDVDFSYIGYNRLRKTVKLVENRRIDIEMDYSQAILPGVIVEVNTQDQSFDESCSGKMKLSPNEMKNIPEFGGEVGLIKSLQTLPGIKAHSDGSAYFFVRGGNKDQNLVLIDEAPVYNPAHLFGFYSIFIPEFTKEITVYKSDIPVNQGDRLASLIDIRTKDGNLNKIEVNGIFNPLVSTISVEGPFRKGKSSLFASYRHSNFSWIYKKRVPQLSLFFADLNLKFNTVLDKKNRMYFTFYNGSDVLGFGADSVSWKNATATVRWNHLFGEKLFSNTLLYASSYKYAFKYSGFLWTSAIANISLKTDFTKYVHPDLTLRFGYNQNWHGFNPGSISRNGDVSFLPQVPKNQSQETVFYLNVDHNLSEKISYSAGFRMPIWFNIGPTTAYFFDENYEVSDTLEIEEKGIYKTYPAFDPRVSLKYMINESSSLKMSFGIYHQFLQMLSNSQTPFTSLDVWLPSSSNIKPQRANQVVLGYSKFIEKYDMEFSAEVYYKNMKNQIDYKPHANMLINPLIEGELRYGKGWAYGLELFLKKRSGRFKGWMSYSFSRTFKKIEGLNDSKKFPAFYDRPHDFSVFLSYRASKRTNLSATWMIYSGSAISTPIGFFDYNGNTVPLYGDLNNDRLPVYHRLDIAANIKLNKKVRKYKHELNFSIYNLYLRRNPISLNFNKVKTEDGKYVVPADIYGTGELISTEYILIRFMPSLTYKFSI